MSRRSAAKYILLSCVERCNTRAVEGILYNDPSLVFERYHANDTILHIAARLGRIGAVNTILQTKGVNIEAINLYWETPLLAAASGTHAVRHVLIKAGANPHAVDANGLTLNQRIEQVTGHHIYKPEEPTGLSGKLRSPYRIIVNAPQ